MHYTSGWKNQHPPWEQISCSLQQQSRGKQGSCAEWPFATHTRTLPYAPPLQNGSLKPVVLPLMWKRFESSVARGGGKGWDQGLASSLNSLSCCFTSILPAALEQRVSSATSMAQNSPAVIQGSQFLAELCWQELQLRGTPSLAPNRAQQGGREPSDHHPWLMDLMGPCSWRRWWIQWLLLRNRSASGTVLWGF